MDIQRWHLIDLALIDAFGTQIAVRGEIEERTA
jgi:hypothetical protein